MADLDRATRFSPISFRGTDSGFSLRSQLAQRYRQAGNMSAADTVMSLNR